VGGGRGTARKITERKEEQGNSLVTKRTSKRRKKNVGKEKRVSPPRKGGGTWEGKFARKRK